MTARPRVGLLGGMFDPIHHGHLAAARAAQQALELDRVRFLPAANPPHRADSPQASGYHRAEMVRQAIGAEAGWEVSDLELRRTGPSYTFDTLATLHGEGLSPLQLFFITGADAFAEIATWHRYPEVLDGAHFVVVARPGTSLDALRAGVPSVRTRLMAPADVAVAARTGVILLEADTPDVSSTDIRARVARGEPIEPLVPPAVAAYIAQHSLYRSPRIVSTGAVSAEPEAASDREGKPIAPVAPDAPGGK